MANKKKMEVEAAVRVTGAEKAEQQLDNLHKKGSEDILIDIKADTGQIKGIRDSLSDVKTDIRNIEQAFGRSIDKIKSKSGKVEFSNIRQSLVDITESLNTIDKFVSGINFKELGIDQIPKLATALDEIHTTIKGISRDLNFDKIRPFEDVQKDIENSNSALKVANKEANKLKLIQRELRKESGGIYKSFFEDENAPDNLNQYIVKLKEFLRLGGDIDKLQFDVEIKDNYTQEVEKVKRSLRDIKEQLEVSGIDISFFDEFKGANNAIENVKILTSKIKGLEEELDRAEAKGKRDIKVNIDDSSIKALSDTLSELTNTFKIEEGSTIGFKTEDIEKITGAFTELKTVITEIRDIISKLDFSKIKPLGEDTDISASQAIEQATDAMRKTELAEEQTETQAEELGAALRETGQQGETAGEHIAKGMQEAREEAEKTVLSFNKVAEAVRKVSEEFVNSRRYSLGARDLSLDDVTWDGGTYSPKKNRPDSGLVRGIREDDLFSNIRNQYSLYTKMQTAFKNGNINESELQDAANEFKNVVVSNFVAAFRRNADKSLLYDIQNSLPKKIFPVIEEYIRDAQTFIHEYDEFAEKFRQLKDSNGLNSQIKLIELGKGINTRENQISEDSLFAEAVPKFEDASDDLTRYLATNYSNLSDFEATLKDVCKILGVEIPKTTERASEAIREVGNENNLLSDKTPDSTEGISEEISQQERLTTAIDEETSSLNRNTEAKEENRKAEIRGDETAQEVRSESQAADNAINSFKQLTDAKEDAAEANKVLASTAVDTAGDVSKEAEVAKEAAGAVKEQADALESLPENLDLTKWLTEIQNGVNTIPFSVAIDKEMGLAELRKIAPELAEAFNAQYGTSITANQVVAAYKAAQKEIVAAEKQAAKERDEIDKALANSARNRRKREAEEERAQNEAINKALEERYQQQLKAEQEAEKLAKAEIEAAEKANIDKNNDVYKEYQIKQKQANAASEKEFNTLLKQRADAYKEIWDINTKIAGLDENKDKGQIAELEKQKEAAKELFNSIQKQLSASEEYYQIENRLADLKKIQADAQDEIATNEAKERDKLTNKLSGYEDTLKELSESGKYAGELGDKISEAANKAKELRSQLEDANIPIQTLRNSMGSFADSFNDITVIQKQVDNLVKSIQSTINKKGAQGVDSDAIATLNDFITKLKQVGDQAGFDKLKGEYEAFIATVKTGGKELENSFNIDKILKKLDKDFLGSSALKKFMPELIADADKLKQELLSLKDSKIDFNTEEGKRSIEELKIKLDELYDKSKLDKYKRATETAWSNMGAKIASYMERNTAMGKEFQNQFNNLKLRWDASESVEELKSIAIEFNRLEAEIARAGKTGKSFFDMIRDRAVHSTAQWFAMFFSFQDILRYARQIAQTVIEIDTATTELRKVSDASSARLSQNFQKSAETARELGSTIKDVINITADWARLGWLY